MTADFHGAVPSAFIRVMACLGARRWGNQGVRNQAHAPSPDFLSSSSNPWPKEGRRAGAGRRCGGTTVVAGEVWRRTSEPRERGTRTIPNLYSPLTARCSPTLRALAPPRLAFGVQRSAFISQGFRSPNRENEERERFPTAAHRSPLAAHQPLLATPQPSAPPRNGFAGESWGRRRSRPGRARAVGRSGRVP